MANHYTRDQNLVTLGKPYVILFLYALLALERRNRQELPSVDCCAIPVYGGSVDCGIVTSRKHTHTCSDIILTDCVKSGSKFFACIFPQSSHWLSLIHNPIRFTAFHSLAYKNAHLLCRYWWHCDICIRFPECHSTMAKIHFGELNNTLPYAP